MSGLDPNLIQRYLYIVSDKIQSKVSPSQEDSLKNLVYQLMPPASSSEYDALYGIQKIFSNIPVKNGTMADILFSDNLSNITKDIDYIISHKIMFFIGSEPVYFNIDDINRTNKKIFISNISIKNASKDIFTLKANYKVSLKINFTDFENLVEKNIHATSVNDPSMFIKASILQVLYPFLDYPGNQYSKQVPDPNGFYIVQTLKFLGDTKKKLLDAGCPTEYSKNYHLTYYKHSFEVFKNEEPIVSIFDNELNAEFVAYETDGTDNMVNKAIEKYVPKTNTNIFKLLNSKTIFKKDLSTVLKIEQQTFEEIVAKVNELNETIKGLYNISTCQKNATVEQRQQVSKDINATKKEIQRLYKTSNELLYYIILDSVQTWTLDTPDDVWPIYEIGNFSEALSDKLTIAGLLQSAAIGATTGMSGGVTGVGVGALTGVGLYAGYSIVSSIMSTKIIQKNIAMSTIRDAYNADDLKKIEGSFMQSIGVGESVESLQLNMNAARAQEYVVMLKNQLTTGEAISKKLLLNIPDGDPQGAKQSIRFTTLGQILGLIMSMDEIREKCDVVCGGYTLDVDIEKNETYYINFANLPISMQNLEAFLNQVLLKKDDKNLFYSSDNFIKDLFEYVVKSVVKDGEIALTSMTNSTPKNTKLVSHSIRGPKLSLGASKIDTKTLFDNIQEKKNIFNTNKEGIIKLYIIGSFEEVKYTDFYGAFRQYMSGQLTQGSRSRQYNSFEFQKFINEKFEIPCILLRKISNSESILKKKYIQFTRLDNKNLETGQFLNGAGLMRQPYQFSADFKAFMSFFVDIGSYVFVAPPLNGTGIITSNMFGYGGLYILKNSSMEYNFQKLKDDNISIPNFDSKCTVTGYIISHGDNISNLKDQTLDNASTGCPDDRPSTPSEYKLTPFGRL